MSLIKGYENLGINFITTNLLSKGYFVRECCKGVPVSEALQQNQCGNCQNWRAALEGEKPTCTKPETMNKANLIDLLRQAVEIAKRHELGVKDWFASGMIELPSGEKQKVFIAQNETGRFTLMLPEDY